MIRFFATLVACSFLAVVAFADDPKQAKLPSTAELAVLERTPPSEERNLVTVRLTLPTLDDRTPLDAAVVARENGRDVAFRTMVRPDPKGKNAVIFARACIPAETVAEGVVRLRERNHFTGKIETIDLSLVEAGEVEKL